MASVYNRCVNNKIPIGAICAAPSIPTGWGFLKGITATAYPAFKQCLTENGAILCDNSVGMRVVTDGLFTTAEAAGVSIDFALELVAVLKGRDESNKIAKQILIG